MTSNSARKRAARDFSRRHGVNYRVALQAVGTHDRDRFHAFATRVLIEAVEGCGIRHWADVEHWDGSSRMIITDLGGESFEVTVATIRPALTAFLETDPGADLMDLDGYLADEFIQQGLFGLVIYRSEVTHRPRTAHRAR